MKNCVVESIRTDFNHYQQLNNDLRIQLLKKKKNLENIGENTNDLSNHLGCIGAKVSVNQKKYQHQLMEFDFFEKELDKLVKETVTNFKERVRDVFQLLAEMQSDNLKIEVYQEKVQCSLQDIDHRRDAVMTSFSDLTVQRSELQDLHAKCCLDLQVHPIFSGLNIVHARHNTVNFAFAVLYRTGRKVWQRERKKVLERTRK